MPEKRNYIQGSINDLRKRYDYKTRNILIKILLYRDKRDEVFLYTQIKHQQHIRGGRKRRFPIWLLKRRVFITEC